MKTPRNKHRKSLHNMTDREIHDTLVTSAQLVRPHSEEELGKIFEWADGVLLRYAMLDLVIRGQSTVQVLDGQVKFWRLETAPADVKNGGKS